MRDRAVAEVNRILNTHQPEPMDAALVREMETPSPSPPSWPPPGGDGRCRGRDMVVSVYQWLVAFLELELG